METVDAVVKGAVVGEESVGSMAVVPKSGGPKDELPDAVRPEPAVSDTLLSKGAVPAAVITKSGDPKGELPAAVRPEPAVYDALLSKDAVLTKSGDPELPNAVRPEPAVSDALLSKGAVSDVLSFLVPSGERQNKPMSPSLKRSDRHEDPDEQKSLSPPIKRCAPATGSDELKAADTEESDDEDEEIVDVQVERLDRLLPPRQVIGPDEHGLKHYIDYSWVGSRKVRTVTTTRVHKIATVVVTPRVAERRKTWCKFGDAVNDDMLLRTSTAGVVKLERHANFIQRAVVPSAPALSPTKAAVAAREEVLGRGGSVKAAATAAAVAEAEARGQKIYPEDAKSGRECFVVRIDQLPFDSKEDNIRELMEQFGRVRHVFLARNPRTRASLRYGFVYFVKKEDGEAAIEALSDGLEAREVGMLTY